MPLSHSPSSSLSVLLPFVVDQHAKNIMVKKLLHHKNKHTHTHTHTKRGRFPGKATTHALSFRRNLEEERGVECLWCRRLKGGTHHTSFRELYPTEGVGQERKRLKNFKSQTNVHQSWTQSTMFSCLSCIKHCTYKLNGFLPFNQELSDIFIPGVFSNLSSLPSVSAGFWTREWLWRVLMTIIISFSILWGQSIITKKMRKKDTVNQNSCTNCLASTRNLSVNSLQQTPPYLVTTVDDTMKGGLGVRIKPGTVRCLSMVVCLQDIVLKAKLIWKVGRFKACIQHGSACHLFRQRHRSNTANGKKKEEHC